MALLKSNKLTNKVCVINRTFSIMRRAASSREDFGTTTGKGSNQNLLDNVGYKMELIKHDFIHLYKGSSWKAVTLNSLTSIICHFAVERRKQLCPLLFWPTHQQKPNMLPECAASRSHHWEKFGDQLLTSYFTRTIVGWSVGRVGRRLETFGTVSVAAAVTPRCYS